MENENFRAENKQRKDQDSPRVDLQLTVLEEIRILKALDHHQQ